MHRLRRMGAALALAGITALLAAGCGGEKTDVSGGVDNLNKRLSDQGIAAKLDCPKEVDGGEGTEFDCTLASEDGATSEKVELQVQKENGDLVVDVTDQKAWQASLDKVSGQEETP